MISFDLVVIGSGPGGYVAAIRAAQNGKKVAVIEKKDIGGTCLNIGCIPSKSYIEHAHWALTIEESSQFGFENQPLKFNFEKLVKRKNDVIHNLQNGISHLFEKNDITYIKGEAIFEGQSLFVNGKEIKFKDLILATGGSPFVPKINGIENIDYLTTDSFFDLEEFPNNLVIIGGGIIAVELGFAMRALGSDVVIIEVAPDILLTEDEDARKLIKDKIISMGIKLITNAKIKIIEKNKLYLDDDRIFDYEQILIATGRRVNLTLANELDLELDSTGRFVKVNQNYQTSKKNIYAIGDLIGGYQLAHVASAEGIAAVANICNQSVFPVDPNSVPRCLYTEPEVASFGLSEEEAKKKYEDVYSAYTPMFGNARAISSNKTDGFIKIISEKKYHQILGAVIVGANATELIHTVLAVKESEGTVDELANIIFAHPTLSEVIGEDANKLLGKAIHG